MTTFTAIGVAPSIAPADVAPGVAMADAGAAPTHQPESPA